MNLLPNPAWSAWTSPAQVSQIAQGGSPLLLRAVGRVFGLGEVESAALTQGRIPGWVFLAGGLVAGVVAGARIQKRWPRALPQIVRGGR